LKNIGIILQGPKEIDKDSLYHFEGNFVKDQKEGEG
jgi:hypothetical protein